MKTDLNLNFENQFLITFNEGVIDVCNMLKEELASENRSAIRKRDKSKKY